MNKRLAAGLLGAFILASLLPVHVFEIRAAEEDRPVYTRIVRPGFRFALGFIHSVEHCPVWDYLRIDGDYRIVLYKTAFWSSRTGLPYAAFGDEVFTVEGDHFTISNMHRVIPVIYQWVGATHENMLKINESEMVPLAGLAGDTLLAIDVRRGNLFTFACTNLEIIFTRGS
ncbi:MAG: DUF1850 domain-containing protein [Desulfobacterales bacterium]